MIDRIIHLGFEVRVELTLGDGEQTWVQTTKGQAQELELTDGRDRLAAPERAGGHSRRRAGPRLGLPPYPKLDRGSPEA